MLSPVNPPSRSSKLEVVLGILNTGLHTYFVTAQLSSYATDTHDLHLVDKEGTFLIPVD